MPANIQSTRKLVIAPAEYTCHVTGDTWKRPGFEINVANDPTHTGKSYNDSMPLVQQGYRMAAHEIFAYIAQKVAELEKQDKNQREILEDPLFDRQIRGNPYRWEHTHMLLKPPKGAHDFTRYKETDKQDRKYSRVDIFHGDKLHAEGALMPWGNGDHVKRINPVLGIPADLSDEGSYVMHSYFDPQLSEAVVVLGGCRCLGEDDRCLIFVAYYGRSISYPDYGFRVVQGSLEEIPAATLELFIKDRASFDKGFGEGQKEGMKMGQESGILIGREEVVNDLNTLPVLQVLEKYKRH